jgi:hypothetical protein
MLQNNIIFVSLLRPWRVNIGANRTSTLQRIAAATLETSMPLPNPLP